MKDIYKELANNVYLMRKDGVSISMSWDLFMELIREEDKEKFKNSHMYRAHEANKKLKKFEDVDAEKCPDCNYLSVTSDWSGISCKNPKCNYTFCY